MRGETIEMLEFLQPMKYEQNGILFNLIQASASRWILNDNYFSLILASCTPSLYYEHCEISIIYALKLLSLFPLHKFRRRVYMLCGGGTKEVFSEDKHS